MQLTKKSTKSWHNLVRKGDLLETVQATEFWLYRLMLYLKDRNVLENKKRKFSGILW